MTQPIESILGSNMTKPSIALFTALLLCLTLTGCSEAPPVDSNPALVTAETNAPTPLSPLLPIRWVNGTHYNIVADTASEQKEVVEYFSFWCPACYRFEMIINEIKPQLANDVAFRKIHVNFMSFTTQEVQEQATKAMLIGRSLGAEELMNGAIFAHIHEQGQKIKGLNDLKQLFISYDISAVDFESTLGKAQLTDTFKQNNDDISQFKEHLQSVPNIVVNGKYQAIFTREMNVQDIVDLVNWLSQQK
jgi:thiol:disulfide interchange protein DsbA